MLPTRVVERLSSYRRHLRWWLAEGKPRIYSHELAALEGATAAQVRRDVMIIGYTGSPARGYDAAGLLERIRQVLDPPPDEGIVLVGLGYLGRAILSYFSNVHPELPIVAAFDIDPEKVGRIVQGCRCFSMDELDSVLAERRVLVAVIAVPVEAAADVAERLVQAGVRGILNFTPVRLRVPPHVFVESVDISVSLEKVAFFARSGRRVEAQA